MILQRWSSGAVWYDVGETWVSTSAMSKGPRDGRAPRLAQSLASIKATAAEKGVRLPSGRSSLQGPTSRCRKSASKNKAFSRLLADNLNGILAVAAYSFRSYSQHCDCYNRHSMTIRLLGFASMPHCTPSDPHGDLRVALGVGLDSVGPSGKTSCEPAGRKN